MAMPEKQELFNEIESLPQTYYEEVLDFLQFLKKKKGFTALNYRPQNSQNQLSDSISTEQSTQHHSLMELQGLGKELWQSINTDEFLEQERNAWA